MKKDGLAKARFYFRFFASMKVFKQFAIFYGNWIKNTYLPLEKQIVRCVQKTRFSFCFRPQAIVLPDTLLIWRYGLNHPDIFICLPNAMVLQL